MLNIREILAELYADRSTEELYIWLNELGLLEPIKRTVTHLNSVVENERALLKEIKCLPVGHIAYGLLHAVNSRIAVETNLVKAKELENILGDICIAILTRFMKTIKTEKKTTWLQINYALKDACDFHNYDYNRLLVLLKYETEASFLKSHRDADPVAPFQRIPALCWKGKPAALKDFLDIFSDQKLVTSKKGLAKLFEQPLRALEISFDPLKADLILQFFYTIKNSGLVTYIGSNGFYQAVGHHIVDFEKDFLKNRAPRTCINILRQSKAKWNENQKRIDSWLHAFTVPATVH